MKIIKVLIATIMGHIILVACNGKSENNTDDMKIIIVNSAEDIGKMGDGYYLNTNMEYRDRDGIRHSRDNIWAPREGESANDASYKERMKVFERSVQEDQYEEGYKDGYNAAKSELED